MYSYTARNGRARIQRYIVHVLFITSVCYLPLKHHSFLKEMARVLYIRNSWSSLKRVGAGKS